MPVSKYPRMGLIDILLHTGAERADANIRNMESSLNPFDMNEDRSFPPPVTR
eukprot:CAMPEP_0197834744 /NCGR_PEP_ID=MMETSP1437-20131217/23517_1 /TAXON_ID=49252 ORGANISM="Eucampia antarctica, Strain CCMP1452" /NCGR_SAMPLE_ID=MMETSP1437 /ASSEMBLY_ACC=CAM_ASM_001096 /LENGTH=51 /DNA_ID=CAMNT_0043439673 /DNA_START=70 /DNA_END=222 /DNA_ORIENTATION=+